VSIARAILRDTPVLLLDEVTASLDIRTEALVAASLRALARRKTVVVVTHRLSTIVDADRILVMSDGRIVETGTHQQLVRKGQVYRQLLRLQPAEPPPSTDEGRG
jgi:ABC-type multidrug transport system fused ATPase/permease subunit